MRLSVPPLVGALLQAAALLVLLPYPDVAAQDTTLSGAAWVTAAAGPGRFALSVDGRSAPLIVDAGDHAGVIRAAHSLRGDIGRVTGAEPVVRAGGEGASEEAVLIGTLGRSAVIDRLVREGKLDVTGIARRWETFLVQVVERPVAGVPRALVIAGSDRRGTIYGIYDLSAQIGVSPWYWWADVPVRRQARLYVLPGRHTQGEPAVRYRGFFINDEAPALSGWTHEKFGGFNHRLYEKVFELLLRLKGNYLWPAMWGNAFYDDDPLNPKLAEEYGVVIGTSHHEPLMRAHDEWRRYGTGAWNYQTNEAVLKRFWRAGMERMGRNESIVTVGMRGDGDEPMSEERNIALLQQIVADQRRILADVTGKDPSAIPQVWALYKEVQDYYDRGMRVPDDVTLLFADDNWGNIRRLPKPGAEPRAGGYGVYYHFDYVGGPRNYKWLNTNQIERVWEQLQLAYRLGADRIWIVNVGDIKPMEFPLEFFLDFAWNPDRWPAERLPAYTRQWAERQFGTEHAPAIADILAQYTKYNSRRKPELLAPETYSLTHYREAERVVDDYNRLVAEAKRIEQQLPAEYRDAFYQLVSHPVTASANLNELYVTVARNRLYAQQGRALTNALADRAAELFAQDARISAYYNDTLAGGKWRHMMDQTHIGYTYWQQPPRNTMPPVTRIELPAAAAMGVAVEGSAAWWPAGAAAGPVLPELDVYAQQTYYIDVFNRGQMPFDFVVESGAAWLRVLPAHGAVRDEQRLQVSVDWSRAPVGERTVPITIAGPGGGRVIVSAPVSNPAAPRPEQVAGFIESNGYVSIEAEHYDRAVAPAPFEWVRVPNLGRTLSGVTALPVTSRVAVPGGDSPHLDYRVFLTSAGTVRVHAYFSPTLDFHDLKGLRYGISFDDEAPQLINLLADTTLRGWERAVSDNVRLAVSTHDVRPGEHVLKFWLVDPGVVLQKLVIDAGGLKPSYLGPPESVRGRARRASYDFAYAYEPERRITLKNDVGGTQLGTKVAGSFVGTVFGMYAYTEPATGAVRTQADVVQQHIDAYNRRDIDAYAATFAADARVFDFPNQPVLSGRAQIHAAFAQSFAASPGGHVEVLNRMVQGRYVVIHGRVVGVTREPYTGIAIYDVRNDRIQNLWLIQEQAGAAPGATSAAPSAQDAAPRLPRLFQDGMVLQRDVRIPVWGWAAPASSVAVTLAGRTERVVADSAGSWSVHFPPLSAGGPHTLVVQADGATLTIRAVIVGDVWIASGQSNMEWPLGRATGGPVHAAAARDSLLREFAIPHSWSLTPEQDLAGGGWAAAEPERAGRFSAVAYYFARDLRAATGVPIGIIHTSWGGSNIETWLSRAALGLTEAEWNAIVERERSREAAIRDSLRARLGEFPATDAGLVDGRAVWADPALDDASWQSLPVPSLWEQAGYGGLDGSAWYRTSFSLTDAEARQDVSLSLGMIDDDDITWVNGTQVGRTQGYAERRSYTVPSSALRPGRNVVAVRVADGGGGGGPYGDAALFYVEVGSVRRPLAGTWRFRVGAVSIQPDGQRINRIPTVLYNRMAHPLQRYPIKGVIWYQGESNANNDEQARAYRPLFAELIRSWRREWSGTSREFPFLWVQLPNFGAVDTVPPARAAWATLRESQAAALQLPQTGQVVTIDVGDPADLHPRNKEPVGQRLARVARRVAYGEALPAAGPTYRRHAIRAGRVAIEFDNVGSGLVSRTGASVRGFAIAGADGRWVWADARIDGDRVIVSSTSVPQPVAVRYAWSNSPNGPGLYNREGFPAAPFRTDDW